MTEEEIMSLVKAETHQLKATFNNKRHNEFLNKCFPERNQKGVAYPYYAYAKNRSKKYSYDEQPFKGLKIINLETELGKENFIFNLNLV